MLDGVYVVEFFDANDLTQAQPQIEELGFKILNRTPSAKKLVVQTDAGDPQFQRQIDGLSAVHGVRMIQNRSLKRPSNNVARTFMGTARTTTSVGSGLNGRGETIAVCDAGLDTGDPATIHGDFAGRVAWIKSYPITPDLSSYILNPGANDGPADRNEGHGTHVAGSVLGSGAESLNISNLPSPIRGMAPDAKLVFQAVEQEMEWKSTALFDKFGRYGLWGLPDDLKQLFADAYAKKAHVHSNSWGGGDAGAYDDQCQQLDEFVWTHKDFCILVAAGNDGSDADGDGKINLTSVTSPATAKNCITVGASESKRTQFNYRTYGGSWSDYPVAPFKDDPMANNPNQVAAFSSRGPTTDGRIKPDVVAPGTFILSTRSRMIALNNKAWAPYPGTNLYFYMGGTSMATPLTSGAVALLRQYLRTVKKITNPSAALLKAALIFGATRLPGYAAAGAVVDNHQGYGRVDLDAVTSPTRGAVVFKDVTQGLRTGQQQTFSVTLKNAPFFRAVLAYTDYPAPTLVNNLNLIVTSPSGKMYIGNGGATSGLLQADSKNNVEVVHVRTPGNGAWKIDVVGSNVPHGPQDFALTLLGPRNP